jgi:tetratricopeptide (TPR) repeat protein
MKLKYLLVLLVFYGLCSAGAGQASDSFSESFTDPGYGQTGTTGAVKGYVKNVTTGAIIADAKIYMENAKFGNIKYELKTDAKGYFYKGGLQPAQYKFTVEKEGFMPSERTVRVRLADTVQADFELQTADSLVPVATKMAKKALDSFREGDWEKAVKEFSEVIAEEPTNSLLFLYRGLAQEQNGDSTAALSDYQKAIGLKPDFVMPYSRAGKLYARQQDNEKAYEYFQKAVELGDQDTTTLYNYAVVLINLGKSPEAKTVLERLLAEDDAYADAYYHLGIITIGEGDSARAKELLEKFVEMDPENPNAPIAKQIIESLK